jgi:hypothetical protein
MAKPTPTQSENDRAALGEHILEHEDDGSGPDPHAEANIVAQSSGTKTLEAKKPAAAPHAYQTRQHKPA